ncbi:unnamed protein product, partial [Phaeothamnion confervicola]
AGGASAGGRPAAASAGAAAAGGPSAAGTAGPAQAQRRASPPRWIVLAAEVTVSEDGGRTLTVRSRVCVTNESGAPLWVSFFCPAGRGRADGDGGGDNGRPPMRYDRLLESGGKAMVPLAMVKSSLQVFSRAGEGMEWAPVVQSLREADLRCTRGGGTSGGRDSGAGPGAHGAGEASSGGDAVFAICAAEQGLRAVRHRSLSGVGNLSRADWCVYGEIDGRVGATMPGSTEMVGGSDEEDQQEEA